jgi:PAS domain S-box-containing protein
VTRVRLEHAARLIRDGVKIEAVAWNVGYRSKKNFYQQFKRRYGTTPLPYRRRPENGGPSWRPARFEQPPEPEPEPVLGRLGCIIRASNKAWRLAVETQLIMLAHFARSRVPMLLTDEWGRYVGANPATMVLTGYSAAELYELPPSSLLASAPNRDTRCVWQLLLATVQHGNQAPNAVIRGKAGEEARVHLVTLKNMLWGRREMSAMLEGLAPVHAPPGLHPTGQSPDYSGQHR